MKVPFAVVCNPETLAMLRCYYHVPEEENAIDELLARTLCAEFAKATNPMIMDTDMAMKYYDLKRSAPGRYSFFLDEKIYRILREQPAYRDFPEGDEGVVGCVGQMLKEGLRHEQREQLGSGQVAGFGRIRGKMPISDDQIDGCFKVYRKA